MVIGGEGGPAQRRLVCDPLEFGHPGARVNRGNTCLCAAGCPAWNAARGQALDLRPAASRCRAVDRGLPDQHAHSTPHVVDRGAGEQTDSGITEALSSDFGSLWLPEGLQVHPTRARGGHGLGSSCSWCSPMRSTALRPKGPRTRRRVVLRLRRFISGYSLGRRDYPPSKGSP